LTEGSPQLAKLRTGFGAESAREIVWLKEDKYFRNEWSFPSLNVFLLVFGLCWVEYFRNGSRPPASMFPFSFWLGLGNGYFRNRPHFPAPMFFFLIFVLGWVQISQERVAAPSLNIFFFHFSLGWARIFQEHVQSQFSFFFLFLASAGR
jgi:hypothetical protein